MKKIIFLIGLSLVTEVYAESSGPGGWQVMDRESMGGGLNKMNNYESMGVVANGRIMSDCPGSFDIGGFDGMRTLELPTSFDGNIGGRF